MALMTCGQHDSLWMDVMGKQVPYGVEYLRLMANHIGYFNQYTALTKLKELDFLTGEEYAKNIAEYAKACRALDEQEFKLVMDRINEYYGEES